MSQINNLLCIFNMLWRTWDKLIFRFQGDERVLISSMPTLFLLLENSDVFLLKKTKSKHTEKWVRERRGWAYGISRIKIHSEHILSHRISHSYSRFRFVASKEKGWVQDRFLTLILTCIFSSGVNMGLTLNYGVRLEEKDLVHQSSTPPEP